MALQNIDDLSEKKPNSLAYLGVAIQLAEKRDYENAVTVARLIPAGPDRSTLAADALVQVYARGENGSGRKRGKTGKRGKRVGKRVRKTGPENGSGKTGPENGWRKTGPENGENGSA